MRQNELKDVIEHSPSIRLLGNRNRLFMIQFYNSVFAKLDERSISFEHVFRKLSEYIEINEIQIIDEEDASIRSFENYESRAKNFLRKWIKQGFLSNFLDDNGDEYIELSFHTEKVLDWVNSLKQKEFVGTESRFRSILDQLKDLVEHTEEDRQQRIQFLKDKQEKIEEEIKRMEEGNQLFLYEDYQIISRLDQLNQSAKELVSDFKQVENNFKDITRSIYRKYADQDIDKASILSYTFDALDELKHSDQGKSFYTFYAYLLQNSSQEIWEELVSKLYDKLNQKEIAYSDFFLRKMSRYLYRAGKDVFAANDKMAEKLGRIIVEKEKPNNKAFRNLLGEIKALAVNNTFEELHAPGIQYMERPYFNLSLERPLNLVHQVIEQYQIKIEQAEGDVLQSEQLLNILSKKNINYSKLRKTMTATLKQHKELSLSKLIESHGGVELGLAEVIAYLNTLKFFKHQVYEHERVRIPFDDGSAKCIELPKIVFYHE